MGHSNRMVPYLVAAAVVAGVLATLGVPVGGFLPYLVFLACPLMMFVMMRGMHGGATTDQDHTGHRHGYEHDARRNAERPVESRR